ncbi:MAG TPA: DUF885 family protein [Gemmatimonadota bacterium]|nr:DUF885 family protein [Gemmatimonadota bacterium]
MGGHRVAGIALITLGLVLALGSGAASAQTASRDYEDLVRLFDDWRAFQRPAQVDGVPDYTAEAMAAQHARLADYRRRLAAIDPGEWPIPEKVDYELVRAEMNGLDFDHRVLRPWARNPAFYVMVFPSPTDVPAREGPHVDGVIELWTYPLPLAPDRSAELAERLGTIPPLLDQARRNLTGDARDLWIAGIGSMQGQSATLAELADRAAQSDALLAAAARRAREATDAFVAWLEGEARTRNGPSGIGAEHYTWVLRNVHLVPYTWQEQVTMVRRELVRAHAALRLEEHRNRDLPPLEPIGDAADYDRRFGAAVDEYMAFLEEEEVVSIRPYLEPALRARVGRFAPADGPREFFAEVDYREPLIMRTHGYHWFDLARMAEEPHSSPIRQGPLLYNIFDGRAEGLATGMEEMMMHAGLLDGRPRARELVWVLLAQRAARALASLRMHAGELTFDEAVAFTSEWTPRGWLREDGETGRWEQHLYLQQPGYGTSYVVGKIEFEELLAERARQLGADFTLRGFMDEVDRAGLIPVSLIRWELTGDATRVEGMTVGASAP